MEFWAVEMASSLVRIFLPGGDRRLRVRRLL